MQAGGVRGFRGVNGIEVVGRRGRLPRRAHDDSSFGYETLRLVDAANLLPAISNVALNVCVSLFATWAGMMLARAL